jgi:hypothetical protein
MSTQSVLLQQLAARCDGRVATEAFHAWVGVVRKAAVGAREVEAAQRAASTLRVAFRGWAELTDDTRQLRTGLLATCVAGWRQVVIAARTIRLRNRDHNLLCFESALRQIAAKGEIASLRSTLLDWKAAVAVMTTSRRRLAAFSWRSLQRTAKRCLRAWHELRSEAVTARMVALQVIHQKLHSTIIIYSYYFHNADFVIYSYLLMN